MKRIVLFLVMFYGCATPNRKYCIYEYHEGNVSSIFEYIETLEKEQDHCYTKAYYEDRISDLTTQNDVLKSVKKFLMKLLENCKEDRAKCTCVYKQSENKD